MSPYSLGICSTLTITTLQSSSEVFWGDCKVAEGGGGGSKGGEEGSEAVDGGGIDGGGIDNDIIITTPVMNSGNAEASDKGFIARCKRSSDAFTVK